MMSTMFININKTEGNTTQRNPPNYRLSRIIPSITSRTHSMNKSDHFHNRHVWFNCLESTMVVVYGDIKRPNSSIGSMFCACVGLCSRSSMLSSAELVILSGLLRSITMTHCFEILPRYISWCFGMNKSSRKTV
jgi:hypothetical protein